MNLGGNITELVILITNKLFKITSYFLTTSYKIAEIITLVWISWSVFRMLILKESFNEIFGKWVLSFITVLLVLHNFFPIIFGMLDLTYTLAKRAVWDNDLDNIVKEIQLEKTSDKNILIADNNYRNGEPISLAELKIAIAKMDNDIEVEQKTLNGLKSRADLFSLYQNISSSTDNNEGITTSIEESNDEIEKIGKKITDIKARSTYYIHLARLAKKEQDTIRKEGAWSKETINIVYGKHTLNLFSPEYSVQLIETAAQKPFTDAISQIKKFTPNIPEFLINIVISLLIIITGVIAFINYFLCVFEFILVSGVSILLIPFMLWEPTKFLPEKTISAFVGFSIKALFCTLSLFLAAPLFLMLSRITSQSNSTDITMVIEVIIFAMIIYLLCTKAPELATSLLTGSPQLSGSGMMAAGAGLAGFAAGTLAKGKAGLGLMKNTTGKTAAGVGALGRAGKAGIDTARMANASVGGNMNIGQKMLAGLMGSGNYAFNAAKDSAASGLRGWTGGSIGGMEDTRWNQYKHTPNFAQRQAIMARDSAERGANPYQSAESRAANKAVSLMFGTKN